MDEHYNHDNFYIFTGDYTDRGDKNKETLQYLCKLAKANNTQFLLGNHEGYVAQWLSNPNKPTNHKQFNEVTLKEIETIDKNQLKSFYKKCLDFIELERNGTKYIISHGGVTKTFIHSNVVKIPSDYYWRGEGEYDDDTSLTLQTNDVIIHGHRNKHNNPVKVNNVINLEQKIEFDGFLAYYII
jgi:predicted MPP superfamily phosphohydrolase